jgi:hypothetical protein
MEGRPSGKQKIRQWKDNINMDINLCSLSLREEKTILISEISRFYGGKIVSSGLLVFRHRLSCRLIYLFIVYLTTLSVAQTV